MPLKTPEIFRNISSMQGISHGSFFFSMKEKIKPSPFACARMAYVDVLLSCGNCDKTLKIKKDCTFEEFRKNVKSIFPHLPKVSKSSQKILLCSVFAAHRAYLCVVTLYNRQPKV